MAINDAMATSGYSGSPVPQTLGLDEPMLISIINASQDAAAKMNQLGNQVGTTAGSIGAAMQSDAGRILNQRLIIWHEDHVKIVSALTALNGRAQQMLYALRNADIAATDASRV